MTASEGTEPTTGYRGAACWPPVVPSVGAVPVEVTEDVVRAGAFTVYDAPVDELCAEDRDAALGVARAVLDEAYPLIAARVRAEAFAERAAIVEVLSEFAPLALPHNDLPTIVRGVALQRDNQHELKDHLAEVARKLTDERDRVRAEERRRVGAAIEGERRSTADADEYSRGYQQAIDNCLRVVAAGSAVPVATPADPVDEVKCPDCEATIRARMSDQPEVGVDFTVTVTDRAGRTMFVGAVDVARGDEYLVIDRAKDQPVTLRCVASDLTAQLPAEQDGQR